MSLPVSYVIDCYRGDSWRRQFRLWADTAKTIPCDLSDATPAAEMRGAPGLPPLATLTCTIDEHVIEVSLAAADTRELPVSAYWDLQLTYSSGDVQTVVAGGVLVRGDITGSTIELLRNVA